MSDLTRLPEDLPVPVDDGACAHLVGTELPDLALPSTMGVRSLREVPTRWLVLYVYPRTGGPGIVLPDDRELIPGARGCTPQSCAFRDHHEELRRLDATVYGVSAQAAAEQAEFARRMHMPFPLLNDSDLALARSPLRLPTFDAAGLTLYRRVTLLADRGRIAQVWYPVFPPDRNAEEVVGFLAAGADNRE